jgi:hypothetical protein
MDSTGSPLRVVCPPDQGSLVAIPRIVVGGTPYDADDEADDVDRLEQAVALLCQFVAWLLAALKALHRQVIDLRCQANYWRAQHERARGREDDLKETVQLLQGEIRELKRRLFASKSETSSSTQPTNGATAPPPKKKRRRGQQPGSKGHGRRKHDHLPTRDEACTLPADQTRCSCCGTPYEEIPGTADGEILEIEVRAHRRRYQRHRYRCACACPGQPALLTAPPPDKLIPKSNLGISICK